MKTFVNFTNPEVFVNIFLLYFIAYIIIMWIIPLKMKISFSLSRSIVSMVIFLKKMQSTFVLWPQEAK